MPTIGDALDHFEEQLFVGRAAEIAFFESWLASAERQASILHVHGPGGIGKSWLLDAFERVALSAGREVVRVDAGTFKPTVEDLRAALRGGVPGRDAGDDDDVDLLVSLNERRPVLMIDTFEELGPCVRYLQQSVLAALDASVRVVFAGRQPLGTMWRGWSSVVEEIALGGFCSNECREYLDRRSVTDPSLVNAIVRATGGHPLALSLATDLTSQYKITEFRTAAQWHLALRGLVEDFLKETTDAEVRELLEAAAIVRRFDESTLAAVTGCDDIASAFGRLCQLSVLRPAEHGLMLHDEVRPILADDLRWRRPQRYAELRANAEAFYRERMRSASSAEETAWLLADQVYFSEHALLRAMFFPEPEPGVVWLQEASAEDFEVILSRWRSGEWRAALYAEPPPEEIREDVLRALFESPASTFMVARDRDGELKAYFYMLGVNRESMKLLPADSALANLVWACISRGLLDELAADPVDQGVRYLSRLFVTHDPGQVIPAIGRWCWADMLHTDVYLASATGPQMKALVEGMGFEVVPGFEWPSSSPSEPPMRGYLLDKSFAGNMGWIEALASGTKLPRIPRGSAFAAAVQQAFEHWDDPAALAASPIAALGVLRLGGSQPDARHAQELLRSALGAVAARGGAERDAAHTVELLFLERVAPDAAMSRMSVSRATLYRLRRRGIELVAAELCPKR